MIRRAVIALLIGLLVMCAHLSLRDARAQLLSPPHQVRIVGAPAHALLPEGGGSVLLPVGTVIPAARYDYVLPTRVLEVTGTPEIFRDGFED